MIETKGLSGGETLLRVLAAMGVEYIFASPGSEWSPVWEALAKPESQRGAFPKYLSSRHEEITVGMASGYAKATRKLPAVMIHTSVGSLHAAMALRAAIHEQVPMVVFCGESIAYGEDSGPDPGHQWLRHLSDIARPDRFVERCVKWSFGVNTGATLPATIQRACQIAMTSPKGPVFVSIPMEILFEKMAANPTASAAYPLPPAADPAGIEELAALLAEARNPLIIAEESGRSAEAVGRLVEVAELLGAGVAETRSSGYNNFPRTHSLHAGFEPQQYLKEADAIFFVSAVAPWHPASASLGPEVRVAVLDENPINTQMPFWGFRTDLCLTAEVEGALALLAEELRKRIKPGDAARRKRSEEWGRRFEERKQAWAKEALALKECKPIDTRWAVSEVSQVLPPDAIVVEETITHRMALHRYFDRLKPVSLFSGGTGGLGTGLGTALGVKVGAPRRPVVCLIGDGAFNYNPPLAAFGFCQEHGFPILTILMNNQGYLSMKAGLPKYYPEGWSVRNNTFTSTSIAPCPDYAAVARAFDGFGETVTEPGQVRGAVLKGLEAAAEGKAGLIDIRLEPVNTP